MKRREMAKEIKMRESKTEARPATAQQPGQPPQSPTGIASKAHAAPARPQTAASPAAASSSAVPPIAARRVSMDVQAAAAGVASPRKGFAAIERKSSMGDLNDKVVQEAKAAAKAAGADGGKQR